MSIPKAPDTPRDGTHSAVDVASLAERAADRAHDAKKIAMHADDRSAEALTLGQRHAAMIERLPAIETKLDLALRPVAVPPSMHYAALAAASAVVLGAVALVALVFLLARPSPPVHEWRTAIEASR